MNKIAQFWSMFNKDWNIIAINDKNSYKWVCFAKQKAVQKIWLDIILLSLQISNQWNSM